MTELIASVVLFLGVFTLLVVLALTLKDDWR